LKNLHEAEIKALLKHVAKKDDSTIKSKVAEPRQQLHRQSDRLQMYNLFGIDEIPKNSNKSEESEVDSGES
jgi:hypothetical protein